MNPLQQYIDLFEANTDKINAHSAPALNTPRAKALEALKHIGRLPDTSDEGYERTDVAGMFAPDAGVNIERIPLPVDVAASFRCGVPNLSTLLAVVVNDRFAPTPALQKNLPEGVEVCSLAMAASKYPALVAAHYDRLADMQANLPADDAPFDDATRPVAYAPARLNTLLAQDGVFIRVAKGIRLERPLQIVEIFQSAFPMAAFRRVLIVAEEESSVAVLKCDHTRPDSAPCIASEVVEIYAGPHADVQWYDIEESSPATSRMCQVFARQADGSELTVCASTLTNGSTRNEFHLDIAGKHTRTRLSGMAIASATQHIDNASTVRHAGEHGHSTQLFKYVLDEEATGAFEGSIEVCHGARFVQAYQSNRNIMASRKARMHTKPQLLIYNDDVKCSHGATTGQLDDKALFYMQTRGIPATTARRMLMQAFVADVIDTISLEPLRSRLHHLVECRFAGHQASCSECHSTPSGT